MVRREARLGAAAVAGFHEMAGLRARRLRCSAGAAAAVVLLARERFGGRRWAALGVLIVVYLTMISMVYSGQSRYHFPAMPFLIMYDGWLLSRWIATRAALQVGVAGRV